MSRIPKNPAWCSWCKLYKDCQYHDGPNGQKIEYTGYDAYQPSAWVLEVVGNFYHCWDTEYYICVGYDPRHGFWMKDLRTGEERNISERAIGRTYHSITEYRSDHRNKYAECVLLWF